MDIIEIEDKITKVYKFALTKHRRVYLHFDEVRGQNLECDFLKFTRYDGAGRARYKFTGTPDCVHFKDDKFVFVIRNVKYSLDGRKLTGIFYMRVICSYASDDVTYYLASDEKKELGFITRRLINNIPEEVRDIYVNDDNICSLASSGSLTKRAL